MKPLKITVVGDARSVHVRTRAEALRNLGNEVVLVSEFVSGSDGVREIAPSFSGYWPGPLKRLQTFRHVYALARILLNQHQDIVHIHFAKGFHAWVASLVAPAPVIVSTMGGDVLFEERSDNDTTWFSRRLIRRTLLGASLVTAKTKAIARSLESIGVEPERILPMVWGIDSSRYSAPRDAELAKRLEIPDSAKVVLSPRSAKPFYNISLALEAFAELPLRGGGPILLVAEGEGDSAYVKQLKKQAHALGVGKRVQFVGALTPEEMPLYYSLADVTISLAPVDGMPQTLLESLASGTPVVLTDLEHYRELVSEEHGVLFTKLNSGDASAQLSTALWGARAKERVEKGRAHVASQADIAQQALLWQEHAEIVMKNVNRRPGLLHRFSLLCLLLGHLVLAPLWRKIQG